MMDAMKMELQDAIDTVNARVTNVTDDLDDYATRVQVKTMDSNANAIKKIKTMAEKCIHLRYCTV
jgi:hypothetical protein